MEELFSLFTMQVARCSRYIRKIKQEEMDNFDLKGPRVSCLYYLYKNDGSLTLKELCDICDEDKAYISRAVDSLEKDGYIECNSKTEKRYKSPLFLTEKTKLALSWLHHWNSHWTRCCWTSILFKINTKQVSIYLFFYLLDLRYKLFV